MSPEKFFDYLEGKLPEPERERLERALIADPELQKQFVSARQIHRSLERPAGESAATTRAGSRGRQLAAAFAVLVAMNVGIGLFYIFYANKPSRQSNDAQQEEALRHQIQSSLQKTAAANFAPPTLGLEPVKLTVPREKQDEVAQSLIAAASQAGGSGTKALPNENGVSVLVLVPASAEVSFRQKLTALGGPATVPAAAPPASPNEPVHLEIVLTTPRP